MIRYLQDAKTILAGEKTAKEVERTLIDKYPKHGARTLAELSGRFMVFLRNRQPRQ